MQENEHLAHLCTQKQPMSSNTYFALHPQQHQERATPTQRPRSAPPFPSQPTPGTNTEKLRSVANKQQPFAHERLGTYLSTAAMGHAGGGGCTILSTLLLREKNWAVDLLTLAQDGGMQKNTHCVDISNVLATKP